MSGTGFCHRHPHPHRRRATCRARWLPYRLTEVVFPPSTSTFLLAKTWMAVESSAGTDMGADADTDTDGLLEGDVQFAGAASQLARYVHSGTRMRDRYGMEDGRRKT